MCGIAGYSLTEKSELDRTLAAQALLAGIAERGADAVGYAYRNGGHICVHKQRSGASALLDRIEVPQSATQVLLHVRDYTKGHPRIEANNHPIRHGSVVGIHNGIIFNDEDIFCDRGVGRPLWLGASRHATFFASTKLALHVVERYTGLKLRKRELDEGTL